MQDNTVTSRHYVAIFLIALATIAVQILVSRIVSVTYYYHFAFAGITFAMLGLTAGALRVYENPEKFSAARANEVLANYASLFGINVVLAVLVHVVLPGVLAQWIPVEVITVQHLATICVMVSVVFLLFAFIQSGVCIALLLTRFPAYTGRLYAFDLCGAAMGCLFILGVLTLMDPINALIFIALVLGVMAWRFLPEDASRWLAWQVKAIILLLIIMGSAQAGSIYAGHPIFRIMWTKANIVADPEYESWNSYSRIAVWNSGKKLGVGWGSVVPTKQEVYQRRLTIDASAATVLTQFDGDLKKIAFLKDDVINIGYGIRPINSVAVIGVGGGRDILSALVFGAKDVTGIEMNPAVLYGLTNRFADFTGNLHKRRDVKLINAEARSYLNSHDARYDLIQISLIDTWAATAAGGLTLTENKLYTTEAWNEFLDRLNDDGMLVVSRWYKPPEYGAEFHRMVAIASDVLQKRNAYPSQHMMAAQGAGIIALAVSKSPFTIKDIVRFNETCEKYQFTRILTPIESKDKYATVLATGRASPAFFDKQLFNVEPSTDDKPFFFNVMKLSRLNLKHLLSINRWDQNYNALAPLSLLIIFALTLVASAAFIAWPLYSLYRQHQMRWKETAPYLVYFAGIGLGFMLIEVSQMQRLMIFLGHPVYGLSVVLFTLLLTSGLGSYVLQKRIDSGRLNKLHVVLALCAVLLMTGLLTPAATDFLKYHDTPARIVASALLLAPMGFFMGMMFPVGVALAKDRQAALLPWYWGINGAASVLASVLAVLLSLQVGIAMTFWVGVACYAMCLLVVSRK